MYNHIVRLNTNVCRVCKRAFKNEKALKDHIFNKRVKDVNHILFKEEIIRKRFENARLECPVCRQRVFRAIKTHFNYNKDESHNNFLSKQKKFFIEMFFQGNSCLDISRIKNDYTTSFSDKYIHFYIADSIGKVEYNKISKEIISKRRKNYWKNISINKRNEIMNNVRESQWGNLTLEQRKNHPWVVAGRKASLESSVRGSKNQKHAYNLLLEILPDFKWKYNYSLDNNWHVDIASPEKKIFIEWDGRHHRIPIHGNSYLNNRKNRDKIKNKIVTNDLKGVMIRVRDDGRENLNFVKKKVEKIKQLVNHPISENRIINI